MIDNRLTPLGFSAEISGLCNLKCPACALAESNRPKGLMSPETWDNLIQTGCSIPGEATLVGFGEPLTHPRLAKMLSRLDRRGWLYSLSTNGLLLDDRIAADLAALKGLNHINVSLDAGSPEIYRKLRGADLEKVLTGLKKLTRALDLPWRKYHRYLLRAKTKAGFSPERITMRPWLTASALIKKDSLAGLKGLPALLAGHGFQALIVQSLLNYNRAMEGQHILGDRSAGAALTELEADCIKLGLEFRASHPGRLDWEISDPDRAEKEFFAPWAAGKTITRTCLQPWQTPHIDYRGNVYPCCTAQIQNSPPLGNINQSGLADIWHGEAFEAFRKALLSGESLPRSCRGCLQAPWGRHPFKDFSGLILGDTSGCTKKGKASLTVLNTGQSSWTDRQPVSLTLAGPRNRKLTGRPYQWVRPDCPATTWPQTVEPGEKAVLAFDLGTGLRPGGEVFQLVVDGACTLAGSQVRIGQEKAKPATG